VWQGTPSRDNVLLRWAEDLQNDFRARLDWCVQSAAEANHPPVAVLNGQGGTQILKRTASANVELVLDASGSSDPDGHPLAYEWFSYPEAGTYRGEVRIADRRAAKTSVIVPTDAAGSTIHVILAVRDQATPPLTRYRRIIVSGSDSPK
jgi:hypothetical protein